MRIPKPIGLLILIAALAINLIFQTTAATYISLALIAIAILLDLILTEKEKRLARVILFIVAFVLAFVLLNLF